MSRGATRGLWWSGTRRGIVLALMGVAQCISPGLCMAAARPNFLIIVSDDQRYDTLNQEQQAYMPFTHGLFTRRGIWFGRTYATTPLCCPSRSSIFTGMYASRHGVTENDIKLTVETLATKLQQAGYFTALVGKYLNSWQFGQPDPPGFDYVVALEGRRIRDYFDFDLYVRTSVQTEGEIRHVENRYMTDVLRDHAIAVIDAALDAKRPTHRPFMLLFAPAAPHAPAQPAIQDRSLYPELPRHRPPSWNEADTSDKPLWLRTAPVLGKGRRGRIDDFRKQQLQTLRALDRAIEATVRRLADLGVLNDTVVIYTSDQGYFWGEHRLEGKRQVYEEAIRVPFGLRYPPLVPAPRVDADHLAANIDIAPTVYDLAGIPIPPDVNGRSLVPLLSGSPGWRRSLFIEGFGGADEDGQGAPPYTAIHTGQDIYVENDGDRAEYYDLAVDPYQLENRIDEPGYASRVGLLRNHLRRRMDLPAAEEPTFGGWPAANRVARRSAW